MKKSQRKTVRAKPAPVVKPTKADIRDWGTQSESGSLLKGGVKTNTPEIKPVEIVKVALPPDKVLHVEAPRDHVSVVAVHPSKNIVQIVPVPKKKLTWWQSVFGE